MPLQAQQIISMATQIAKCPGFTSQAGQLLNSTLQNLCMNYDLELARTVYFFSFNSGAGNQFGPYTLPANWLRAKDKDVFYTILGVVYPMIKIDLAQYDWLVQQAGLQSFPTYYTTDMSQTPPVMFVWVPPSGSFPVTARYYQLMPDISTPETSITIPWFPHDEYLYTKIASELMKVTNDDRQEKYELLSRNLLDNYLKKQGDMNDLPQSVALDRRIFGPNLSTLKNTKTIGW